MTPTRRDFFQALAISILLPKSVAMVPKVSEWEDAVLPRTYPPKDLSEIMEGEVTVSYAGAKVTYVGLTL